MHDTQTVFNYCLKESSSLISRAAKNLFSPERNFRIRNRKEYNNLLCTKKVCFLE